MARPLKTPGSAVAPYVYIAPEDWDRIFSTVAESGSLAAALRVTIGERRMPAAYAALRRDLDLKARLESAEQAFRDFLLAELVRRGVHGVERTVRFKGEAVGVEREFSDNALLAACRHYISNWLDKRSASDVSHHVSVETPGALWSIGEDDLAALSEAQKRALADCLRTVQAHRKAVAEQQRDFPAIEVGTAVDAEFEEVAALSDAEQRELAELCS
jgi:hypothetical protein